MRHSKHFWKCFHFEKWFDFTAVLKRRPAIMCKNNEKNDKFYRKVAILMYTEMVNFRPQSWKAASKLKHHNKDWALRCHWLRDSLDL